jgi:thioesterase domain-containing protein
VGRRDFQVKIRGFRIELGEIERTIEIHPEVEQAVVMALESTLGQKSLAAYYVLRSSVSHSDLRAFLQTKLPNYMVPTYFTALSALPLTPNGKVDRKSLPSPQTEMFNDELQAPTDEIEAQLLEIWKDLLEISNLCVTDNFFDMGGHSLLITRMLSEIEAKWDTNMPINILFEAPTIRQLATFLRSEDPNASRQTVVPFRKEGLQPPVFCVPGSRGNLLFAHRFVHHWGDRDHPIYGLQEPLDSDGKLPTSIPEIAAYYIRQIKTVQSEGPYHLVGYSIGGLIAYEMAQQLRRQGQEVALLGLLDPVPPIAAIKPRAIIQRFATPNRFLLILQLSLLKLVELQDLYQIRLQDIPKKSVPSYLLNESKTWLQSSEAQDFWQRFRSILGFAPAPKATASASEEPPALSVAMVMKYDRAILHYLPEAYSGRVTFFCSEEWNQDVVNWRAWERWYEGGCDRYPLSGSHITFYRENTAEIVSRLLP